MNEVTHCNFCGKHRNYVAHLITANNGFNNNKQIAICDECVVESFKILKQDKRVLEVD